MLILEGVSELTISSTHMEWLQWLMGQVERGMSIKESKTIEEVIQSNRIVQLFSSTFEIFVELY